MHINRHGLLNRMCRAPRQQTVERFDSPGSYQKKAKDRVKRFEKTLASAQGSGYCDTDTNELRAIEERKGFHKAFNKGQTVVRCFKRTKDNDKTSTGRSTW